jgi:hypothetical protein
MSGLLSRLLKPIGRPLWKRLQSRIVMVLHNDPRFQRIERRSDAANQAIDEMRLKTNHVPVLDGTISEMRLQTNHVPVLDQKISALESASDPSILDFRLDQLKRDADQKFAAEIYLLKQAIYEVRADQDSFGRQLNAIKQALEKGPLGSGGDAEGQFTQLRAVVGRLEGQYIQMRSNIAHLHDEQADAKWRDNEHEHSKLAQDWVIEEWSYLCPMDVNGKEFIRVGRKGDGGYVMVDDIGRLGSALSFGVGTEISFDLELAERGVRVLLYDHTIDGIPAQHPNIRFRRLGLGSSTGSDDAKRQLSSILAEERIGDLGDVILKIDIEGDEWEVLKDIPGEVLEQFSQILLELHGMADYSNPDNHINRMYVLKKLSQTHQAVHLHANNWRPYKVIGGAPVPEVLEVTFASRKHYTFSPCKRTFPTSLDYPNNANRAEILLAFPTSPQFAQNRQ